MFFIFNPYYDNIYNLENELKIEIKYKYSYSKNAIILSKFKLIIDNLNYQSLVLWFVVSLPNLNNIMNNFLFMIVYIYDDKVWLLLY